MHSFHFTYLHDLVAALDHLTCTKGSLLHALSRGQVHELHFEVQVLTSQLVVEVQLNLRSAVVSREGENIFMTGCCCFLQHHGMPATEAMCG